MGAYNVLFHFDKLYKRLGPLRRKFAPDHQGSLSLPVPLFFTSTLALLWMAVVLGYLTLHEMAPGHRGSHIFFNFYLSHLLFGCLIPIVYSFMLDADFWWSRRVVVPLVIAFSFFYLFKTWIQPWEQYIKISLLGLNALILIVFLLYMLRSKNVNRYYEYLRGKN